MCSLVRSQASCVSKSQMRIAISDAYSLLRLLSLLVNQCTLIVVSRVDPTTAAPCGAVAKHVESHGNKQRTDRSHLVSSLHRINKLPTTMASLLSSVRVGLRAGLRTESRSYVTTTTQSRKDQQHFSGFGILLALV